jgi:hypothetical protein
MAGVGAALIAVVGVTPATALRTVPFETARPCKHRGLQLGTFKIVGGFHPQSGAGATDS